MSQWHRPGVANAVGIWCLVYFASLGPIRFYLKGFAGIFDLMWCCNIALLLAGVGLLSKSGRLVSISVAMCAFAHLSWNVDAGTWLVAGFFPIGTSSYLGWESTTRLEILSTLHHIWFLPLVFYALKGNQRLQFRHVLYAFLMSFPITYTSRLLSPLEYEGEYININMAHEVWRDTDIPPLKFANAYVDTFYPLYMAYMLGVANFLNLISFVPIMLLYRAIGGHQLVNQSDDQVSAKGSRSEPTKRKTSTKAE